MNNKLKIYYQNFRLINEIWMRNEQTHNTKQWLNITWSLKKCFLIARKWIIIKVSLFQYFQINMNYIWKWEDLICPIAFFATKFKNSLWQETAPFNIIVDQEIHNLKLNLIFQILDFTMSKLLLHTLFIYTLKTIQNNLKILKTRTIDTQNG